MADDLAQKILDLLAQGKSQAEITRLLHGVSRSRVQRVQKAARTSAEVAVPAAALDGKIVPEVPRDFSEWADYLREARVKTAGWSVELGRRLNDAKAAVGHTRWLPLLTAAGIGERMAQRLMAIARDPWLSDPSHVTDLPMAVMAQYELTRLTPKQLDGAKTRGVQLAKLERSAAVALVESSIGKRKTAVPTPPAKPMDRRVEPQFVTVQEAIEGGGQLRRDHVSPPDGRVHPAPAEPSEHTTAGHEHEWGPWLAIRYCLCGKSESKEMTFGTPDAGTGAELASNTARQNAGDPMEE